MLSSVMANASALKMDTKRVRQISMNYDLNEAQNDFISGGGVRMERTN